jgi:hypothetical protein
MGVWKPQFTYQVSLDMPLEDIKGISAESGDSGNWESAKKFQSSPTAAKTPSTFKTPSKNYSSR